MGASSGFADQCCLTWTVKVLVGPGPFSVHRSDRTRNHERFYQSALTSYSTSPAETLLRTTCTSASRAPACVALLCVKGSNKTTACPYSQREGKCEGWCHTLSSCTRRPFLPLHPRGPRGAVTPPPPQLSCVYLRHLRPWESCARRRSDNVWIRLSLTLPLRKDIAVQAHSAALLISGEANPSSTWTLHQCEKKSRQRGGCRRKDEKKHAHPRVGETECV